jgi:hypothetical protein
MIEIKLDRTPQGDTFVSPAGLEEGPLLLVQLRASGVDRP